MKLIHIIIFIGICLSSCQNATNSKQYFVQNLVNQMTLEEKVGQMTQVDKRMLDSEDDIKSFYLGSILSGGGSVPKNNTPQGWVEMSNRYQEQAISTRLKIPLIYGIDAVHGHNNVVGATIFPHNIGLGCSQDPDLIYQVNHATSIEVAATGLNWTFSPCITVPQDDRWGRQYEGFSESTDLVSKLTAAAIKGYEDAIEQFNGKKIAACAKHFIGDGGTSWQTGTLNEGIHKYFLDRGDTQISEDELRKVHLPPYKLAIEAGVKTVMISFNSWNGIKCHGNDYLITDLLKTELDFQGFVITDWAGIDEIPGEYKSDIITSINAGIDMVMVPGSLYGQNHYKTFIRLLLEAINEGSIPIERIDDAVTRILNVKYELGLFDNPFGDANYTSVVGSNEHRKIARDAVRKSVVLLKNDSNTLPLNRSSKVTIVGSGANNIGIQNGGWTVEWQGKMVPDFDVFDQNKDKLISKTEFTSYYKDIYGPKYNNEMVESSFHLISEDSNIISTESFIEYHTKYPFQPDGTTILQALKTSLGPNNITYDPRALNIKDGETIIAVIGEYPYAEGYGDNPDLEINSFDKMVLQKCYESNNNLIVIMLSGRPLMIEEHIHNWDGFLAAWLPGMAGEGISDVLMGDYSPTGKLSFTWPKSINQLPINIGDEIYNPLFPFNFGLSY